MLPPNIAEGFTLAEVLITLLIIGVVAGLAIPALIAETQDAELKTAWKKAYADLSQATSKMVNDNGGSIKGLCPNDECLKNLYLPYLNYSIACTSADDNSGKCWHMTNTWKYLYGSPYPQTELAIKLTNGNLVGFKFSDKNCTSQVGITQYYRCGQILVDVNGFKSPNTIGKDIFSVHILENRIMPQGIQNDYDWNMYCILDPNSPNYYSGRNGGQACSAKYLYQ